MQYVLFRAIVTQLDISILCYFGMNNGHWSLSVLIYVFVGYGMWPSRIHKISMLHFNALDIGWIFCISVLSSKSRYLKIISSIFFFLQITGTCYKLSSEKTSFWLINISEISCKIHLTEPKFLAKKSIRRKYWRKCLYIYTK